MGPYCQYCDNRCFVRLPMETPVHIVRAYGGASIVATCAGGQQFERERVGYCWDDIKAAIAANMAAEIGEGAPSDGGAG